MKKIIIILSLYEALLSSCKAKEKNDSSNFLLFYLLSSNTSSSTAVVTTLAGASSSGYVDATSTVARFNQPFGVVADGSGNIYVADSQNNVIRKVTSTGVVTTFAGSTSGTSGYVNATGTAARFNQPYGIAIDSSGNLYVADTFNHAIRKITSAGVVTTLAGSGNSGYTDATGTSADFARPYGVAVDSSGNVYVGEYTNYTIRKVTSAGVVTTFAGSSTSSGSTDGTGTSARFNQISGLALDSSGNLYVADTNNNSIRKVTSSAVVTTLAGSTASVPGFTDGAGSIARFKQPTGVTVDASGNLYIADATNNAIRKITSAGVVTTLAGSTSGTSGFVDGIGYNSRFKAPYGISVDSSGNIFVGDFSNNAIRKIVP